LSYSFKVFTADDLAEWKLLYSRLEDGKKTPFSNPEYLLSNNIIGSGKVVCFFALLGNNYVLYPTNLNKIETELSEQSLTHYYDLESAYGYNSPVITHPDSDLITRFNHSIKNYCTKNNIIAEFIRFCPLTDGRDVLQNAKIIPQLNNVILPLHEGYNAIWEKAYDPGVRKAIRKAHRSPLNFSYSQGEDISAAHIETLYDIYTKTMLRNKAKNFYMFPYDYISTMIKQMSENALIASVEYEEKIISSELLLLNKKYAFGYIGGTLKEYYTKSPNVFLRDEINKLLIDKNLDFLSLGGGRFRNDNIYKYKKSFSRYFDSEFFIGKVIHNGKVLNALNEDWTKRNPDIASKYENYFLKYKLKDE
jgi:hypothetical protein